MVDLLMVYARQFEWLKGDLQEAMLLARRKREYRKEIFNVNYHTHLEVSFKAGNIVLLHNIVLDTNISVKLYFKWISLYKIWTVILDKGTNNLEELDSTI